MQTHPNPPTPAAVRQPPNLEQMAKASDRYARARVREHADYTINIRRLTTHKLPSYESQLRQCPCGSQLPCPWHEPFPDRFWRITPFTPDYRYLMEERGIPFQEPEDMLA